MTYRGDRLLSRNIDQNSQNQVSNLNFTDQNMVSEILRQEPGRFDRRYAVGPARWPHFDLLWIHQGQVRLTVGTAAEAVDISAPGGILIYPDTPFEGSAVAGIAEASISHFTGKLHVPFGTGVDTKEGFVLPPAQDCLHIHNLIRLSLSYEKRGSAPNIRKRLLCSILDCFLAEEETVQTHNRLRQAWAISRQRLEHIRGLPDVSASIGLSESAFRALHRQALGTSAGKHLQHLRLQEAERLLSATGLTIAQISKSVGYAHAESFSAAFSRSRGNTPTAYRRWCKRFA